MAYVGFPLFTRKQLCWHSDWWKKAEIKADSPCYSDPHLPEKGMDDSPYCGDWLRQGKRKSQRWLSSCCSDQIDPGKRSRLTSSESDRATCASLFRAPATFSISSNSICIICRRCEPVWPSGKALGLWTDDVGSIPLFGSPVSSKIVTRWDPTESWVLPRSPACFALI